MFTDAQSHYDGNPQISVQAPSSTSQTFLFELDKLIPKHTIKSQETPKGSSEGLPWRASPQSLVIHQAGWG